VRVTRHRVSTVLAPPSDGLFAQDIVSRKCKVAAQKDAAVLLESIVSLAFTLGVNARLDAVGGVQPASVVLTSREALVAAVKAATR
jgi:hypothetical protein